ncbi:GreA/GreB family elongation factor [Pseudomonas sp. GCM10022188]|uniref:GreA/GreB family elongation factor n=1 Tax=Pseudomonas TaxID=286 RepID=UPI001E2BEB8D|nr:GreA/GreB family elongation factor [Pseudomonas oryzagri]MCC6074275.1 GreA/GreB family elongation factor [Pseudomonas oryzagri]
MSRAFVHEELSAEQPEQPVERSVSDQPNYVTAHGLAQLEERLAAAQQALTAEQARGDDADRQHLAELERDLRYLRQRLQSAQVVPPAISRDQVQIGSRVAFADAKGHEHEVQLVGEDEADAATGKINWESPLGRALLGAAPGDEVVWRRPAGDWVIEILEILPPRP